MMESAEETKGANGIGIVPSKCQRFPLDTPENVKEMLKYLDEQGYAVIASAASNEDIEKAKNLFWEYMEQPRTSPEYDLKRNDCSTWDNWIGNAATGIVGSPKFNHNDYSWHSRLLPKVKQTFSHIWATDELIVSFDAGNAFRPWRINPTWATMRNWWHVDQNSLKGKERQGRVCVQGLVTYYDVTEESGGFCLIPGTHRYHDEVCQRNPSAQMMHDYVYIENTDAALMSAPAILPLAQAGDLIIWDSRLIHCNTPGLTAPIINPDTKVTPIPKEIWTQNIPRKQSVNKPNDSSNSSHSNSNSDSGNNNNTSSTAVISPEEVQMDYEPVELLRLVSYVCMVPRSFATSIVLDRKKRGFLQSIPTSHWPQENITFLSDICNEETARERKEKLQQAPAEMLRLVGFTEREIETRYFDDGSNGLQCCNVC